MGKRVWLGGGVGRERVKRKGAGLSGEGTTDRVGLGRSLGGNSEQGGGELADFGW